MGKLHKIRRLLRDPEERKKLQGFTTGLSAGVWARKGCRPMIILYRSSYHKYVEKIFRDYLAQ